MSCSARQNELKESPVTSMPGEYLFVLAFWGGRRECSMLKWNTFVFQMEGNGNIADSIPRTLL